VLLATILILSVAASADEVADSRALTQEALAAYKAKDHSAFLAKITAASDLRPSMPTLLYYRAAALALNGRGDEALDVLERIARMGMVYDAAREDDFASLRQSPRFRQVLAAFGRNAAPIGSAATAFTIPEKGIISEGLAFDPVSGDFFVSSVRKKAIYRIRKGKPALFVASAPDGVFGMAIDPKRRVLWAASSSIDDSRGAVLKIDLRNGRLLRIIPAQGKHLFGDVVLGADGTVYVSDSASPAVYRIVDDALSTFIADGPFVSLQGIAPASGALYVADYSKGIAAVDIATGDIHFLASPADSTLLGIDGLYRAGPKTLIATQNGTNPQRVLRIELDGMRVAGVTTLAANLPEMKDITLGTMAGGDFCFNAAAQWDEKDPGKLVPAIVLRIPSASVRQP
jgi:sugar lactone lactonase YvrE